MCAQQSSVNPHQPRQLEERLEALPTAEQAAGSLPRYVRVKAAAFGACSAILYVLCLVIALLPLMKQPRETHVEVESVSEQAPEGERFAITTMVFAGRPGGMPNKLAISKTIYTVRLPSGKSRPGDLADCPERLLDELAAKLTSAYPEVRVDFRQIVRTESYTDFPPPPNPRARVAMVTVGYFFLLGLVCVAVMVRAKRRAARALASMPPDQPRREPSLEMRE